MYLKSTLAAFSNAKSATTPLQGRFSNCACCRVQLAQHGASALVPTPSAADLSTPLHFVAGLSQLTTEHEALLLLFTPRDSDLFPADSSLRTPLHAAAAAGFSSFAVELLQHVDDPEALAWRRDARGRTFLGVGPSGALPEAVHYCEEVPEVLLSTRGGVRLLDYAAPGDEHPIVASFRASSFLDAAALATIGDYNRALQTPPLKDVLVGRTVCGARRGGTDS